MRVSEPVVAYIVFCHHKPEQALRLARTIRRCSPRARVVLRHDHPTGYLTAEDAASVGAVLLVSPIRVKWGHWTLVAAALEAFEQARDLWDPAWTVLVSGQDYPVRPLAEWEDGLLAGTDEAVVAGEPLVTGPLGTRFERPGDTDRMRYTHRWYWLPKLGVASLLPRRVVRLAKAVYYRYIFGRQAVMVFNELPRDNGWALGVRRGRVPWTPERPAYKGEQWVALSRKAVKAASTTPGARRWQRYFSTTLIPDEAYFPVVLADAHDVRVRRAGVSWLRWDDDPARPHPVTMGEEALPAAVASGRPFARKFDEDEVPGLLDVVDARLLGLGGGAVEEPGARLVEDEDEDEPDRLPTATEDPVVAAEAVVRDDDDLVEERFAPFTVAPHVDDPTNVEPELEPWVIRRLQSRESASAMRGVAWAGGGRLTQQVLQFAGSVVLARLLLPEDYGLVVIVGTIAAFANLLSDLGIGAALVQSKRLTDELMDTAFWINVAMGVVLTLAMIGLSWPVAQLYGKPEVQGLLALASLNFVFSLTQVPNAIYERVMRFDVLARVEVTSSFSGLLSTIVLAAAGAGATSLVIGPLMSVVMASVQLLVATRYRPRTRPTRRAAQQLWAYSSGLLTFNFIGFWGRNIDNLLLGRFISSAELGYYSRAYNLMTLPVYQIGGVVNRVLMPRMSQQQDDRAAMGDTWMRTSRLALSVTLPIAVGLAVTAPDFVRTLYGPRWDGAAQPLLLLALAAPAQIVGATTGAIYQALAETRLLARRGFIGAAIGVACISAGLPWGVLGVCWGILISGLLGLVVVMPPSARMVHVGVGRMWATWRGSLMSAVVLAAAVVAVREVVTGRGLGPLLVEIAVGAVAYAAALRVLDRETWNELVRLGRPLLDRLPRPRRHAAA